MFPNNAGRLSTRLRPSSVGAGNCGPVANLGHRKVMYIAEIECGTLAVVSGEHCTPRAPTCGSGKISAPQIAAITKTLMVNAVVNALDIPPQNDIDNAAYSIRAVDRRCTIEKDLDPLNLGNRN